MSNRVYGKDRIFRKYLSLKVVIAESAVPFLSALSVYFSFANELALIYIFIIFSINFYLIGFAIRRRPRINLSSILPDRRGLIMATTKRIDSQFYRLLIDPLFGSSVLGAIYPALVIGRAGSILGNLWYTFYFKKIDEIRLVSKVIIKYLIIIVPTLILVGLTYAFISQFLFVQLFDWDVQVAIYFLFFFINVQFFHKTFLRSISVSSRSSTLFNIFILISILTRTFAFLIFQDSLLFALTTSIFLDLLVFFGLQTSLNLKLKAQKTTSNNVLRLSCLPTKEFPASGITSHMISENSKDLLAIPFPRDLLLFKKSQEKLIMDLKFDLRDKSKLKIIRFFIAIYFSFKISRYIRKNNIPVIHIHWFPLILIPLFSFDSKRIFVYTFHGEDARYMKYSFIKWILNYYMKVFVVGSYWTRFLKDQSLDVHEIENFSPIEEDIIRNLDSVSKIEKKDSNVLSLCLVGSEKEHKNIKIFNSMPKQFMEKIDNGRIKLVFVGINEGYFSEIVKEYSPQIVFKGRCSRIDTLSIINQSDALLLPSLNEGNPKVVWEAIELGIPPILSETITFKGFDHERYPFRFDPNKGDDFWAVIEKCRISSDSIILSNYFKTSSYQDIREIYESIYQSQ